jgi:hypothetical protein
MAAGGHDDLEAVNSLKLVYTISMPMSNIASAYSEPISDEDNTSTCDVTLDDLDIESYDGYTGMDTASNQPPLDGSSLKSITFPDHDDIYGSYDKNSVDYSTFKSCLTSVSSTTMTKTYYDEDTCVIDESNCSYL